MRRWLLLVVGLTLGIAGFVALTHGRTGDPPLDRIDAESRAQLERVLERADRDEREGRRR